jgi:hypothetical protein
MKSLVLFSGTGSVEKSLRKVGYTDNRGVDIDPTFQPHYCVDILEWDYRSALANWIPDYVHSSPVCCEFSKLKNINETSRNLSLGYSLVDKTLEIINHVKTLNPNLKYTIENPSTSFIKQRLSNICYKNTSYCMYDYPYQKNTTFFFEGFNLNLKPRCKKDCKSCLSNNGGHKVRLGLSHLRDVGTYKRTNVGQIGDTMYFNSLREEFPELRNFTNQYFRYRIPEELCDDIIISLS